MYLSLVHVVLDVIFGWYYNIFEYLFTFFFLPTQKKNELLWNFGNEITQLFQNLEFVSKWILKQSWVVISSHNNVTDDTNKTSTYVILFIRYVIIYTPKHYYSQKNCGECFTIVTYLDIAEFQLEFRSESRLEFFKKSNAVCFSNKTDD